MAEKRRNSSTATFVRCAELRQRAGMEIDDLIKRVGEKPSKASYHRLERGMAVRASSAFKIANTLNKIYLEQNLPKFEVEKEVQYV